MKVNCKFDYTSANEYTCFVDDADITQRDIFTTFEGQHKPNKNNDDVMKLMFEDTVVHYLPKHLHERFPNLEELSVRNCGLKEINLKDLLKLHFLGTLRLNGNDLETLPIDLFTHTINLKKISFGFNKLERVSSMLFDSIPDGQWEYVSFRGNKGMDVFYSPGEKGSLYSVQHLKEAIDPTYGPPIQIFANAENTKRLMDTLEELEESSDFTIRAGTKIFPVHKSVLRDQSSVLAMMFENDELVKATNELEIRNWSEEVVVEFLLALYTGQVVNEQNALGLFSIASELEVQELKPVFEKLVVKNLSEENADLSLTIGNVYGSTKIVEAFNTSHEV
jgi:BTB/POZ domain